MQMNVTIENNELVIRVPIKDKLEPSKTGKTLIVASSSGNQTTSAVVQGQNVVVGFNAYIYPPK